jgi:hypothetical protein
MIMDDDDDDGRDVDVVGWMIASQTDTDRTDNHTIR